MREIDRRGGVRSGTRRSGVGEPSPNRRQSAPDRQPRLRLQGLTEITDGWDAAAGCRGEDASLFFGPNGFEPKHERIEREAAAKAVCSRCPALVACREHALVNAELYGVWGGLGEADRRTILAERGQIARAV